MSYQEVKDRLHHGHRKVANNTHLTLNDDYPEDECVDMRLHRNLVARFYPGYLELFSAGWHTTTTKDRLNLALSLAGIRGRVSQHKYQWYVDTNLLNIVPFTDGIKLTYVGG